MSPNQMINPIQSGVIEALRQAGFVKRSDTWYLESHEMILIANLQKSQFGRQYYLNLAVWVKALGAAKAPKENQAHVRMRADSLVQPFPTELFDLEQSAVSDENRRASIQEVLSQQVFPVFLALGTSEGMSDALRRGTLSGAFVHKSVRNLLLVP